MIRRQVVMPVAPERLWEALTDPDQIAGWFGARVEWDLAKAGAGPFRGDDGTERAGRSRRSARAGTCGSVGGQQETEQRPARGGGRIGRWRGVRGQLRPGAAGRGNPAHDPGAAGRHLLPAPARRLARLGQAPPADTAVAWTAWDGRLVGAWAGLARTPGRLRPFLGTRERWRISQNQMSTPSSPPWRTPPGGACSTSCPPKAR